MIKAFSFPGSKTDFIITEDSSIYIRIAASRYVLLRSLIKAARKMKIIK